MKRTHLKFVGVLTILFMVAGSFLVASIRKPMQHDRKRSESREQELREQKRARRKTGLSPNA